MNKAITLLTLLLLLLWGQGQAQTTTLYIDKGGITIGDGTVSGYDQSGAEVTTADANNTYIITQTDNNQPTANNITITGGTINVTLQDVNIKLGDNPIWVQTGATLNLAVSGENKLESTGDAGIRVTEGASLVINGEITDKLHVVGGSSQTGIGENKSGKGGSVTIRGGYVVAEHTGSGGAGIGQPGWSGSFQAVTIEGGYVEATGHGNEGSIAANRVDITGGVVRLNDDKLKEFDNTNRLIIRNGKIDKDATLSGEYLIGGSALISVELGVTVTLQENSTLTLAEGLTLLNQGTITGGGTLVNNGTLYNEGSLTVNSEGKGDSVGSCSITGNGTYKEENGQLIVEGGDLTINGYLYFKNIVVRKDTRLTIDGLQTDYTHFGQVKSPIDIEKGAQLTLVLKGENRLTGNGDFKSAIHVPEGATLVISGESTGLLTAVGGNRSAGIGGNGCGYQGRTAHGDNTETAGTILIYGGHITATGGHDDVAGIGGGSGYNGGTSVTSGGNGSPGGSVEKIAIYGGTVIATANSVGIGGGKGKNGGPSSGYNRGSGGNGGTVGELIIAGGNIVANGIGGGNGGEGGTDDYYAQKGRDGTGGSIHKLTISGGTITAEWIGAGKKYDEAEVTGTCDDFTVTGGSIKLTDTEPLRKAEPKGAEGEDLYLCITPALSATNSLSVGNHPFFIDSHHSDDNNFYLYLPGNTSMAVRNKQGKITTYTVTKKSSADGNGNWFDFGTETEVTPTKTFQATGQPEITYGDTEVTVQWKEGGSSMADYSVPMNVVSYQVLIGSEVAYENRVAVPDITQELSLSLPVFPAGEYTLKLRYGGDTQVWPSAEIELPLKIGKKTVTVDDIQVKMPEQAITYDGQSHPVTVTPAEGIEGLGTISVKYAKQQATDTWEDIEGEPKDAGTYRFTVEIAEGSNYKGASFPDSRTFDIQKATPDANCFTYEKAGLQRGLTLEEIKEAIRENLKPKLDGIGKITVTCFHDDEELLEAPAASGSYSFRITVAEGTNYTASSEALTHGSWIFDFTPVKDNDCFLIKTVDDLVWFRDAVNDRQYRLNARLIADIDLKDIASWKPIGDYEGTFDGNGHVIRNLTLNTAEYSRSGLFGYLYGEIKNLGLEGVKIKTDGRYRAGGILVGFIIDRGAITNCYVTDVSFEGEGNENECGIVGIVFDPSSSLTGCYTTLNRLIGNEYDSPTVTNCYYLQSDESGEQSGTPLSAEQFTSGELVHLLQAGQDEKVWGQRLGDGGDLYPVLLASFSEEQEKQYIVHSVTCYNPVSNTPDNPILSVYLNSGDYTPEVTPVAAPGYEFKGWSTNKEGKDGSLTVTITDDTQLYAIFVKDGQPEGGDEGDGDGDGDGDEGDNHPIYYTVTLPTLDGVVFDQGAGGHEIEEWDSFVFRLTLDEDYNQSTPIVTTSRGETLQPRNDGAYVVRYVRSDIEIYVAGIVKNPDPVANAEVKCTEPTARVINGNLLLSVPETTEVVLFNFSGRALRRLQLPVGDTWINDLPAGPYIVRFDRKKVVKLVINR